MKWWLQFLRDPVVALDLGDDSGKPDHGKIVGFFTFVTMLAVLLLYVLGVGKLLPLGHTIALISASFGWAAWRTFLKARSTTATEVIEAEAADPSEPNDWADGHEDGLL